MIDFENEFSKLTVVDSEGEEWTFSRDCVLHYDEVREEKVSFINMEQLLLIEIFIF